VVTLAPAPLVHLTVERWDVHGLPTALPVPVHRPLEQPPTIWTLKGTWCTPALEGLFSVEPALRTLDVALAALDAAFAAPDGAAGVQSVGLEGDKLASFHEESTSLVHRYFELEDPTKVDARRRRTPRRHDAHEHPNGAPVHLRGIIDRLDRQRRG